VRDLYIDFFDVDGDVVDPPAGYVEQTKTEKKNFVDTKTTTQWAEMTYTNADGIAHCVR